MVLESAAAIAPHFVDAAGKWGRMDMERWVACLVGWLDGWLLACVGGGSKRARALLRQPSTQPSDSPPRAPITRPTPRWSKFIAFLDSTGLLTSKVQSRTPGPDAATLDELRAPGGGGERVAAPRAADLATNGYLP
jgi:hypothetical protein